MDAGREEGLNEALLDRLALTEARIAEMAKGVREIAELDDPVGEVVEGWKLPNGLDVAKKRVPIGVVAVVYEARPNVTIDAAALCLKSGNAAVLRGSSSAESSNAFLAGLIGESLPRAELPVASVSLLAGGGHEQLAELATAEGLIGTRFLATSSPFSNFQPSTTSPTGSSRSAISRTPFAISAIRASVSVNRSISASFRPSSRPASTSARLASSSRSALASMRSARSRRQASLASRPTRASRCEASFASRQTSSTVFDAMATH